MAKAHPEHVSCGIRVNPEYSEVEVELYNPCAPGTRFGVTADLLPEQLPEGIEGFHCHCHCEFEFLRAGTHTPAYRGKIQSLVPSVEMVESGWRPPDDACRL